jgi:hypothetical protein
MYQLVKVIFLTYLKICLKQLLQLLMFFQMIFFSKKKIESETDKIEKNRILNERAKREKIKCCYIFLVLRDH